MDSRAESEGEVTEGPVQSRPYVRRCGALYAVVSGRDHLAIRLLVQLGLRSEELFALRRDDVRADELVIDEAIVNGHTRNRKRSRPLRGFRSAGSCRGTESLPGDGRREPEGVAVSVESERHPDTAGELPRRVLKPAAIHAGITVSKNDKGDEMTAVNFQSLGARHPHCSALAQRPEVDASPHAARRSADYSPALPASDPAAVKAAAMALETDLLDEQRRRADQLRAEVANDRLV